MINPTQPRHTLFVEAEKLRNLNSGLGQYAWNLLLAMHKHCPNGWQVVAMVPYANRAEVELAALKSGQALQTLALERIHKIIPQLLRPAMNRAANPDANANPKIVWLHGHQGTEYLPPKLIGLKRLLATHDLNFLQRDDYSAAKKQHLLRQVQKLVDGSAAIVCISEAARAEAHKNLRLKCPSMVVHNGVPQLAAVAGIPPSLLHLWGKAFALCLGIVEPKKAFHLAIEALPLLADHSLQLVIAGPNPHPYAQSMPLLASNLGVVDRVHICGRVTEEEKVWLLANAKVLIHPSRAEGFGLPLIEALSLGTPVAASPLPALLEVASPLAAFATDWTAQALALATEEAMRRGTQPDFSARAKTHAARFTWDAAAQGYWQAVTQLFG